MKNKVKGYFLNIEKGDSAAGRIKASLPGITKAVAYHPHPTHFWNSDRSYDLPMFPGGALTNFQPYPDGVMAPYAATILSRGSDSALLSGSDELGAREAVLEVVTDGSIRLDDVVDILINEGAYSIEK